jgi:predicted metalloprotease
VLGIPESVMPHVRRFGFSGVIAVGIVVIMIFGINPVTVLTGQVAEPLPHTTLTALEAIAAGDGTPEDLVGAVEREANGFWERAFRSAAVYYPPATIKMVPTNRDLGCGLAGSDIGTFYCPDDSTVYVDMASYADLVSAFPEQGHKAEGYLIGLAYGHHVLAALGEYGKLDALPEADRAVREQQLGARAACYAGAWNKWAGLERLLHDPEMVRAIDSVGTGSDVAQMPSRLPVPRELTPPSPAYRLLGFDLGYGIPAAGSCSDAKVGQPI